MRRNLAARTAVAALLAALVIAGLGGCNKSTGPSPSKAMPVTTLMDAPTQFDVLTIKRDLKENQPVARARYKGRTAEVIVSGLTVDSLDAKRARLWVKFKGEGQGLYAGQCITYLGTFPLDRPENAVLKDVKNGLYTGMVRGTIKDLGPNPAGDCDVVTLDPAWVVGDLVLVGETS
jgi:hypothetical protein